jgi:hypothetical protein
VTISGVLVVIVLAGCGGASHKSSTASTGASSSRQLAPGASAALASRLLTAAEIRGFTPQGAPVSASGPESWVVADEVPAAQQAKEVASLQRLGFIAAIRQTFGPSAIQEAGSSESALSTVEQFRSPSGARAALAATVEQQKASSKPGEFIAFGLPPIPGARGFALSNSQTTGINIVFTDGPYYYLVGADWPAVAGDAPTRASLVAEAAEHLYDRVKSLSASS